MQSQEQLVEDILHSLERIDRNDPASDKLASYLYTVDKRLPYYLEKFAKLLQLEKPNRSQLQESGKLLEQVVYLAFCGLKGATSFKSFQSAGPQYDLLVSGDNVKWLAVCKMLYLDINRRDIVVEAKAKNSRLPDKDFARLCSIMNLNLTGAGLGVFFTLRGATGFPNRDDLIRKRAIRDCRLRQVLFHAQTQKSIIVLDKEDIFELNKNASLIQILIRKIRDLHELSGLPITPINQFKEMDLPGHLKEIDET